jgi:hypothetical protein
LVLLPYNYSSKFARPAQIIWSGIPPAKAQRREGYGERTKTLIDDFHPQSPNFAPFASLRETLRVSVAALPRWANSLVFLLVGRMNELDRKKPVKEKS